MKWNNPRQGQRRAIQKFAWFPTQIRGTTIWLESYFACQEYDYIGRVPKLKWYTKFNTLDIKHADRWSEY